MEIEMRHLVVSGIITNANMIHQIAKNQLFD